MTREEFEKKCIEIRDKYSAIPLRQIRLTAAQNKASTESWHGRRRHSRYDNPPPPIAMIPKTASQMRKVFRKVDMETLRNSEIELARELEQCFDLISMYKSAIRNVRQELAIRWREVQAARNRKREELKYPERCPRCKSNLKIIRAGFTSAHRQMFRCGVCNSTFINPEDGRAVANKDYGLVCHRCNGKDVENRGPGQKINADYTKGGGRQGYCFTCKKGFTQGGVHHLMQNYEALLSRVRQACDHEEVFKEMLQDVCLRILQGEGYVATIDLSIKKALHNAFGNRYIFGSDHWSMQLQQGQKGDRHD